MAIRSRYIEVSASIAAAQDAERLAAAQNLNVWRIDLNGVHTKLNFLAALARTLRVPDYFGSNWDALEECLRDFDEGGGWLLIFENADSILELPSNDLKVLGEILFSAAEHWHAEGRLFSVHFVGSHKLRELLGDPPQLQMAMRIDDCGTSCNKSCGPLVLVGSDNCSLTLQCGALRV